MKRPACVLIIASSLALIPGLASGSGINYQYTSLGRLDPFGIGSTGLVVGTDLALNGQTWAEAGIGAGLVYSPYGPDPGKTVRVPGTNVVTAINAEGLATVTLSNGLPGTASPSSTGPGLSSYAVGTGPNAQPQNFILTANNDRGQSVGWMINTTQISPTSILQDGSTGEIRSGGTTTTLPGFGGRDTSANDINNSGQVVGGSATAGSQWHPFLYSNGKMIDLGTMGAEGGEANRINNAGQIIGTLSNGTGNSVTFQSFLYENGKMSLFGAPGANATAQALNDLGQVVGTEMVNGVNHAILYSDGVMTDLNSLVKLPKGWVLNSASGINDAGEIVGYSTGPNDSSAGFLLTPADLGAPTIPAIPAPEPSTLATFGVLAIAAAYRAFRRRGAR